MLKPLLLAVALVAAAGYPVYLFLQPPRFGVSPSRPLGELERIDAWIQRWHHYTKTVGRVGEDLSYERFDRRFEGAPMHAYVWKDLPENAYPRGVQVVVDGVDSVQAVRAYFPSRSSEPREPVMSSEELVWRLWVDVAGRTPVFRRVKGEDGVQHVDSFETAGIRGRWTKVYMVPNSERSICDSVELYRVPVDR